VPGPAFVTGGSGFVGGAVVQRLVASGREVRALARSDAAAERVRALGARPVAGDIFDVEGLLSAMRGCSSVFHVAGVNAMCLRDPADMFRMNVDGAAAVVRAAAVAGVDRLVHTSSASTIGEPRGAVGREDTSHRGSFLSAYERSKFLAERRVLGLADELGLDVVCVNPSSVQGPGRTEGSARLLLGLLNRRMPVVVDTWVSIVDVDDCAEGHLRAEVQGVRGERYLLSGAALSIREAVDLLRTVAGAPRRVLRLPRAAASVAGVATGALARLTRTRLPLCPELARTLLHGHRYDGSRARRELGLRYTPIEETIRRTVAWYAERGLVGPIAGSREPMAEP
jgi:dihydroflavonol-4-reductase